MTRDASLKFINYCHISTVIYASSTGLISYVYLPSFTLQALANLTKIKYNHRKVLVPKAWETKSYRKTAKKTHPYQLELRKLNWFYNQQGKKSNTKQTFTFLVVWV